VETKERLPAIDLLRGLVMVLMTLDHTRDFFSNELAINPTDPVQSNGPLFITRWVTHFCAPVFVLLAGVGAALAEQRGLTKLQLARFLVTRGLWLIFLEFTLVRLGFFFTLDFHELQALVIWVLGCSMVLLAGLQFLPRPLLLLLALAMIFGHNALDNIKPEAFGSFNWLWIALHSGVESGIPLGNGYVLKPAYKLIPWVGVMALGYCLGPAFGLNPPLRRRWFFALGLATIAGFLVGRMDNRYGDPLPWAPQADPLRTAMSFLNCEKYPPSLCYLQMTLGPALVALAAFDRPPGWIARRIIVIGRVPLFFYLLHLPLIHGLAVLASCISNHGAVDAWLFSPPLPEGAPPGYGYPLPVVYAVWFGALLLLYPLCAWFAGLKRKYPGGILSYL
jgi:uncharacterized membrane protein